MAEEGVGKMVVIQAGDVDRAPGRLGAGEQVDGLGADSRSALEFQGTAMFRDDARGDGKSQAGAAVFALGGEEGFADVGQIAGRDPHPLVAHQQL
jgi:hypothetical protein